MKIFCRIFIIYLLALVIMPCSDIHAAQESGDNAQLSMVASEHEECPHEKGVDFCTPFCICNCCGQIIFISAQHKVEIPKPFNDFLGKSFFSYQENWHGSYLEHLFHPPKV